VVRRAIYSAWWDFKIPDGLWMVTSIPYTTNYSIENIMSLVTYGGTDESVCFLETPKTDCLFESWYSGLLRKLTCFIENSSAHWSWCEKSYLLNQLLNLYKAFYKLDVISSLPQTSFLLLKIIFEVVDVVESTVCSVYRNLQKGIVKQTMTTELGQNSNCN
jgi:hypothetical protein